MASRDLQLKQTVSGVKLAAGYENYVELAQSTTYYNWCYLVLGFVITAVGLVFIPSLALRHRDPVDLMWLWDQVLIVCFSGVIFIFLIIFLVALQSYDPFSIQKTSYINNFDNVKRALRSSALMIGFCASIVLFSLYLLSLAAIIFFYVWEGLILNSTNRKITFIFVCIFSAGIIIELVFGILFDRARLRLDALIGGREEVTIEYYAEPGSNNVAIAFFTTDRMGGAGYLKNE